MDLRKEFPFGRYKNDTLSGRINIYGKGVTIDIEECKKFPELEGKSWNIEGINYQWVGIEKSNYILNLDNTKYTLKYKDEVINLDDLLKELKYKDGSPEFDQLFYAKIKDGMYLSNYKFDLFEFFTKNEENFFMLQDCLVGENFCLPKNEEDKKRLLDHVAQKNEGLSKFLEENAFTHEELNNKKKFKVTVKRV